MIEVSNLCKDYGDRRAINNLNFSIKKGEVVGFLGPNGAGKSTTMKIITGFMAPTSGAAKISGIDIFEYPIEVKKRIGYLPEIPPVYPDMYVGDYLNYVAQLKQVRKDLVQKFVKNVIEKTNLGDVQNRIIGNLSKGYKQRVGIAQAIVSDPEVLILDEPTVGLDPKQVAEIRNLIISLKGHHTFILSTHILSEVQATCNKVIIINKGEIVAEDSIDNLAKMEKGRGRIHLKLRKQNANIKKILESISGVYEVLPNATQNTWDIVIDGGEEVVDQIASTVVNQGFGLLELTPVQAGLEDVFLKLTYGRENQL